MSIKKRILVAPLNWGLGHATRCIPIIHALKKHNFLPIIASDGATLNLLKKEFPELDCLALPGYNITYSKKAKNLKLKLLQDSPRILKAIKAENKKIKQIIKQYQISGIISDNRFGTYSKHIPSVFITHQLQVLSGNTTWLSTTINNTFIRKFHECWVPDIACEPNLSGKLSHVKTLVIKTKYIGPISRFKKKVSPIKYDLLVLLSGPEPQRTLLEKRLLKTLKAFKGNVLFVRGKIEDTISKEKIESIEIVNYLTSLELEIAINKSNLVVCRSGYTTIMDLAKLEKKAFFIPTPGQSEQEYLAKRLKNLNLAPYCKQEDFTLKKLKEAEDYNGLTNFEHELNYEKLFSLF